jgi:cycloartenol synthase
MLYVFHIYNACWEVMRYFVRSTILGIPVSYPGDAIKNPQTRKGKWARRTIKAPQGWRFAEAEESHRITDSDHPRFPLTGEPAGRQTWYYLDNNNQSNATEATFNPAANPNSGDKLFRQQMLSKWKGPRPDAKSSPSTAKEAASKGISFYQMIQCDDGHWAGDYGGPLFLMPGFICALYITQTPFPPGRREAMALYIRNHQQVDGGWGTHIECASTMFGTVLNYTALRLLGEDPNSPHMIAGRKFIHEYGGALYAPSWAKFWLAAIGVYDWQGINSVPVEMWLLPRWFIFHPGKLWCHCRMVYLPMGYVYCKKYTPDVANDPILSGLRQELYTQRYETIKWNNYRQTCAEIDEYSPLNPVMKIAQDALAVYERIAPYFPICGKLREWGLKFAIDYIHAEDIQTNFIDIGPVNKALNMLSVWIDGGCDPHNEQFLRHIARVEDYLWVAEDGMKMQGYNGSQCWDTAFAAQAMIESGLGKAFADSLRKSYSYFDRSQIKTDEDNRDYWFRHISKGGWPFSNAAHGWPISDCTAEGMKSVLALHKLNAISKIIPEDRLISEQRLCDGADVMLSYQNADGGWATYENNRGYGWYEMLNPSEVFGDIMIDYSYIECSSACVTALKAFHEAVPAYRSEDILYSIARGRTFMKSIQRRDGSWYGSWGNCFCYGTWFGIEGLIAAGEPTDSFSIRKAVQFLLGKQNANGGWGESYLACVNKAYPIEGTGDLGEGQSGVVQTAWAMLALMKAGCSNKNALTRGKNFLMERQMASGDWDQEGITGVFNRSCGITYTAYRNVFPIWALARYANTYEK